VRYETLVGKRLNETIGWESRGIAVVIRFEFLAGVLVLESYSPGKAVFRGDNCKQSPMGDPFFIKFEPIEPIASDCLPWWKKLLRIKKPKQTEQAERAEKATWGRFFAKINSSQIKNCECSYLGRGDDLKVVLTWASKSTTANWQEEGF
jgi:hypothetical protein